MNHLYDIAISLFTKPAFAVMVWDDLVYALVLMVISAAISYLTAPRPERNDAVVQKLDVPTAEAGKGIPVIFGDILLKDANVIDYFDPKTEPISSGGGGK